MRQIKFRALYEGGWYYQTLEEIITITLAAFRNGEHKTQFTGLKDKNGKEIYEGDILTINKEDNNWKDVVVSDKNFLELSTYKNKCVTNCSLYELHNQLEVIGNIYSNPELLNPQTMKDIFYQNEIYINVTDAEQADQHYLLVSDHYPVVGECSFKDGEDVSGKYKLQHQYFNNNIWNNCDEYNYNHVKVEHSRRIVALPTHQAHDVLDKKIFKCKCGYETSNSTSWCTHADCCNSSPDVLEQVGKENYCGRSTIDGRYVNGSYENKNGSHYINSFPVFPWSIGKIVSSSPAPEPSTVEGRACSQHKKEIAGISDMKVLAEMIGDLHYESLSELLLHFANKIYNDGKNDLRNDRDSLAIYLYRVAGNITDAYRNMQRAWEISKPFMNH